MKLTSLDTPGSAKRWADLKPFAINATCSQWKKEAHACRGARVLSHGNSRRVHHLHGQPIPQLPALPPAVVRAVGAECQQEEERQPQGLDGELHQESLSINLDARNLLVLAGGTQ